MSILNLSPGMLVLCFAPALINVWAIWHAGTRHFDSPVERALWVLAAVFLPVVGGLAYLGFGMRRAHTHEKIQ